MSYLDVASGSVVSQLPGEKKAAFIRKTYGHLALAIAAFALIEAQFIRMGVGAAMATVPHLVIMIGFVAVGFIADKWARSNVSQGLQYAGLGLYVVAFALVASPLLHIAATHAPSVIFNAAIITAALVTGITAVVFTTRKDFSFLGPIVTIGLFVALGLIVASSLFGFELGLYFAGAMILLMAASILWTTSNIVHVYREEQHVAASLALFSSVAMMFYYIVYFLLSLASSD